MALLDVLACIDSGDDKKYYQGILRKLKDIAEARGCSFGPPRSEWELDHLAEPRRRVPYFIEDVNSGVVGFVLVPSPKRAHADVAWNRLEDALRSKLGALDSSKCEGKSIRVVIVQVWSSIDALVLPFQDLGSVAGFMKTGDFTVKKDGAGGFVLYRPQNEGGSLRLDWRPEGVFKFL